MTGTYEHSIDAKGRLFIPAKLREELGVTFYLAMGVDECLAIYPQETWNRFTEKFASLPMSQSAAMRPLFEDKAVVAVGEIGLDHHWPVPREEQYALFEAQLQLAKELDLPVSVHDREAHAEMYELLRKYKPRGALHCYSGSADDAVWLVEQGLYLGFGGAVTYKGAKRAAKVLAMHFGTLDMLMAATEEELMAIPDVGPTTAAYLRAWFDNPQSQHQIRLLRDAGVSFDSKEQVVDRRFAGKTFVLTGALEHFSRDEASAIIERFGGKTSSSVSKKTSYLLAGENTGSKYQKALTLGTPIITEAEFLDMIQE